MTKKSAHTVLLLTGLLFFFGAGAQRDTLKRLLPVDSLVKEANFLSDKVKADSIRKAFSPKKATLRSLVLPGWGQVYNKKYWKLPIVYGALGTTGAIFFYNLKNYRDLRFAYTAKFKTLLPVFNPLNPQPGPYRDSTDFENVRPEFKRFDLNSLRSFRDEFRRNIDYSVLFFLVFWALNVVDATVDAHLKTFDVSPDLSLRFKLGPSQLAGTNGVSLVLQFK